MRCIASLVILATIVPTAVYAQQPIIFTPAQRPTPVKSLKNPCLSATLASTRLICAEPDLLAVDSILSIAFRDASSGLSLDEQKLFLNDQRAWLQDRNKKCGLVGKDRASLTQLRLAKDCIENAMEARIADLQAGPQTSSIPANVSAPTVQDLVLTPIVQPLMSSGPGGSGLREATFQALRFSAPAEGISGTIDCSATSSRSGDDRLSNTPLAGKQFVMLAVDDNANSYSMFENDTWSTFMDGLRNASYASCAGALRSGRLKNSANESMSELSGLFEVSSPQRLFIAYSTGQNTPWTLLANLPKARKTVKSDLGIQTWVDPRQLSRNPYFFKDSIIGLVTHFDRMISDDTAVFEQSGTEIFVSGVSAKLFENNEMVVLAGRVKGNKGLINSTGSEVLMPALDYVGTYKCGDQCEGL